VDRSYPGLFVPTIFLPNVDRSYPGSFMYATNGPGYEWSTLGVKGLEVE